MPQIVEAHIRQPSANKELLVVSGKVARLQECPDRRGEDEALIAPALPLCEAFIGLAGMVRPQRGY